MSLHHSIAATADRVVGGPARRRVIVLLAAVLALQGADTSTVGAVAAQLEPGLGIGDTGLGLLVTVSAGVGAVATLPLGALVDRTNRIRLLTGAIALWAVAMVASGAATGYVMLLVTRLALGVVLAVAGPTIASLAGDLFPTDARGRLYGFILGGELLGGGLGFLVSGNVSSLVGWRWSFWLLGAASVLVAAALWRWLSEPDRGGGSMLVEGAQRMPSAAQDTPQSTGPTDSRPDNPTDNPTEADAATPRSESLADRLRDAGVEPHRHQVLTDPAADRSLWWSVRYVLSVRTNLVLIVASALGYSLYSAVRTFGVIFVQQRFGVGQSVATLLLILLGAGAVVGVLTTGRISDGLIGRGHLSARPIVAGVSFLLTAALFAPALAVTSVLIGAPLFFAAAAGVGGANPPLDAARLDLIPARLWGRAEAVRTAARSLLEAGAPLLVGILATRFGDRTSAVGRAASSGAHHADGLFEAFLVMLVPVVVAGVLLLARARVTYPRDVATAVASDANTASDADTAADVNTAG